MSQSAECGAGSARNRDLSYSTRCRVYRYGRLQYCTCPVQANGG